MTLSVFEYDDYRRYLNERLPVRGAERGARSSLARRLKCRPAFISQVLRGGNHFSLEQCIAVSEFLQHSLREADFFLALVQENRAGTPALRKYFQDKLTQFRSQRSEIASRVQADRPISGEQATRYYSKWIYAAVHIGVLLKGFRTVDSLSEHLGVARSEVTEAVDFLLSAGLLRETDRSLHAHQQRVHLDKQSPLIRMHHINWRLRAIQALERTSAENLHYSGILAVTGKAAEKIRKLVLQLIEDIEPSLLEPNEEELHCLSLDFFPVTVPLKD